MTPAIETPAIEAIDLCKHYPTRGEKLIRAVDGVSFAVQRGETFALVGESGCGKTTTAEMLLMLQTPSSGRVHLQGQPIRATSRSSLSYLRKHMQVVFQNPRSSLDPRMRVRQILAEPFQVRNIPPKEIDAKIDELLQQVQLEPRFAARFPHEISGGQAQRIAVARALAVNPSIVVLDEPTSALDVSVQAQIINLLKSLQRELSLTYLFISHDLRIVRHLSNRVAIMYLGKIVEQGPTGEIFADPRHPYTQALLSAVPKAHPSQRGKRIILGGDPPSAAAVPSGCRFRTRCFAAQALCSQTEPELRVLESGRFAACHFA
jgi:oligopeptide transport system ATP-binding protein